MKTKNTIGFSSRDNLPDLDNNDSITNKLSKKSHRARSFTFTQITRQDLEFLV